MSTAPIDPQKQYCESTQGWLDDLDRDSRSPVEATTESQLEVFARSGDEHDEPIPLDAEPPEATINVGDMDDEHPDHPGEPPIALDEPNDVGDRQPLTHADDDKGPRVQPDSDETPLPGTDLVDQLTRVSESAKAAHDPAESTRNPRYNKRIAVGFAAATAAAALVVSGALLAMRSGPHTSRPSQPVQANTRISVLAAPSSTTPAPDNQDSTIPYTATSVGCLPGSTTAQSVADPDSTQAWVCVTGGNVGQYLVLNLGHSMVITAVSIIPGWVGTDAAGADQWHQHRVLTRVQWSFNDVPPTVVPQETASVHGEATKPMPSRGILASRVILLVQQTGRAPADTTPTATPTPGGGGHIGEVLGPPAAPADPGTTDSAPALPADQSHTDPADNTFAVSSIKILGHPPQ